MAQDQDIIVIDRIVSKPGRGQALFDRYMQDYAPVATQRGLTLSHRWVSPPVWLHDQSNILFMVWSVKGVAGYWAVEQQARFNASTSDFWRDIEPLIISRTRSVMSDAANMESLADV